MNSSSPIAKITFRPVKQDPQSPQVLQVSFEFPQLDRTISADHASVSRVTAARSRVAGYLHSMLNALAEYPPTYCQTNTALQILQSSGEQVIFALLDDDSDKYVELQEAFAKAWPTFADFDENLPVIEVIAHDEVPFLDPLPLFGTENIPVIKDCETLRIAAARFLGFSAVVQRVTPFGGAFTAEKIHAEPTLSMQFLRHRIDRAPPKLLALLARSQKTSGTYDEAMFFRSLSKVLNIQGPWPDQELDREDVKARVLDVLFDPNMGLDGGPMRTPVQIQHFACHCSTSAESDDDYEISLSTPSGVDIPLKLHEIRSGYVHRLADRRKAHQSSSPITRSLVVFNACGSAQADYRSSASFPHWFLRNHHRGFVGTETYVPDDTARDYCERLYRFLLAGETPIGEAIVHARRQLLLDFRDPTGIVYSFYGDPALYVEGVHMARPTGWYSQR